MHKVMEMYNHDSAPTISFSQLTEFHINENWTSDWKISHVRADGRLLHTGFATLHDQLQSQVTQKVGLISKIWPDQI